MLVLHSMPDLSTPQVRDEFHRLAAERGAIVSAYANQANYPMHAEQLSVKAAFGGREDYYIDGTRRAVDDDVYLIINHGHPYQSRLQSKAKVHSIAIVFSDAMRASLAGTAPGSRDYQFEEHLRPHDRVVTPVLKYLVRMCAADIVEPGWYEEQTYFLLDRMRSRSLAERMQIESLPFARRRTRIEVHRRIRKATDYLLTCFAGHLTLSTLAEVACMDRFHFLRMFRAVHGVTPLYFLACKRISAAARQLTLSQVPISAIARSVGLGSGERLLRAFRETLKMTPSQFRHRSRLAADTELALKEVGIEALLRAAAE